MLKKCIGGCVFSILVICGLATAFLLWAYQVVDDGNIYLPNAPGTAAIVRERDSGVAHIRGDTWESVVYGQGFAHAQTRLWQLERTRRVIRGEISELFGEDTIKLDTFMRTLGLRRMAEDAWETLPQHHKDTLQAYADGINDSVLGTSLVRKQSTGKLLPPEFYAFGLSDLSQWRPWHPTDTIALLKYKSFYLSWNWMHDLGREALRQKHPDLADLREEINPFLSEDMIDLTTIIDDDDLKAFGQYSEKTLIEKYYENMERIRAAEAPLPAEVLAQRDQQGKETGRRTTVLSVKAQREANAKAAKREAEKKEADLKVAAKLEAENAARIQSEKAAAEAEVARIAAERAAAEKARIEA